MKQENGDAWVETGPTDRQSWSEDIAPGTQRRKGLEKGRADVGSDVGFRSSSGCQRLFPDPG